MFVFDPVAATSLSETWATLKTTQVRITKENKLWKSSKVSREAAIHSLLSVKLRPCPFSWSAPFTVSIQTQQWDQWLSRESYGWTAGPRIVTPCCLPDCFCLTGPIFPFTQSTALMWAKSFTHGLDFLVHGVTESKWNITRTCCVLDKEARRFGYTALSLNVVEFCRHFTNKVQCF